jgi:hypothetical protein
VEAAFCDREQDVAVGLAQRGQVRARRVPWAGMVPLRHNRSILWFAAPGQFVVFVEITQQGRSLSGM